jgi:hypothetical protein
MNPFAAWINFYLIVGSAAGALVGLQFVAMALVAGKPVSSENRDAALAFATPTVVHFASVLLLSAIVAAPWGGLIQNGIAFFPAVFLVGLGGLLGILYTASVVRRLRKQTAYTPEFEDWLFHAVLPLAAYLALAIAAAMATLLWQELFFRSLFLIAAAILLLLVIGMHNAWDLVTYHVFNYRGPQEKTEQDKS